MRKEALMQRSFYWWMRLGKQWLLSWTVYSSPYVRLGKNHSQTPSDAHTHTHVVPVETSWILVGQVLAQLLKLTGTVPPPWQVSITTPPVIPESQGHRSLVTSCTKFEEEKQIKVVFGHKQTLINCDFFTRPLRIHGSRRPVTCTFIIFASWQNSLELSLPAIKWLPSHSWTWTSPLLPASLMPGAAAKDGGILSRKAEGH